MSSLQIEVVTPLGIIFTGEANSCTAPGVDGEFQILPDHAAMVSNLNIGIIRFCSANILRFFRILGHCQGDC